VFAVILHFRANIFVHDPAQMKISISSYPCTVVFSFGSLLAVFLFIWLCWPWYRVVRM